MIVVGMMATEQPLWDLFRTSETSIPRSLPGSVCGMATPRKLITAAEMDTMTPQQRADAVDASIVRNWDHVTPEFRARVFARSKQLADELNTRA